MNKRLIVGIREKCQEKVRANEGAVERDWAGLENSMMFSVREVFRTQEICEGRIAGIGRR